MHSWLTTRRRASSLRGAVRFALVFLLSFACLYASTHNASAQATLSAVSVTPTGITGGNSSTGTVTLTQAAPTGGLSVSLSSSNGSVASFPTSVTVAAGASTAPFTVTTTAVAKSQRIVITGVAGATQTAILNVHPVIVSSQNPPVQAGNASGGSVPPTFATATAVTWAVYDPSGAILAGVGPGTPGANGWSAQAYPVFDLGSNTIKIGFIQVVAPISAQPMPGYLVVAGIPNGWDTSSNNAAYFDVVPAQPVNLLTFSVAPASVHGGTAVTGTVNLDGPAPYGGIAVNISNSNTSAATAPTVVTVPAGSSSQTFSITTLTVAATATTNLGASFNGATMYQQLAVTPSTTPSELWR